MNSPKSTTGGKDPVDVHNEDGEEQNKNTNTKKPVTLEHQDTPSTTSVEEVTDSELHHGGHGVTATATATATTTTSETETTAKMTEATIVKLQSFVRGSLTRARVSVMVGQLIEELLATQQKQQQQQQHRHDKEEEEEEEGIEETEKVEHDTAAATETGAEGETETVRDDDTTVVVTNVSAPTNTTTISAKPDEASTPKTVKKTYAFPTAEVPTASFATSPRAKSHKHQASSPVTLKPHYFPSGKQQQFVPVNTPAEWPPKDGLVVPPAVEYSSPPKSKKPPVPPLSFVPPISEATASSTKHTESNSEKAVVGTAPNEASSKKRPTAAKSAQQKEDGTPKKESLRERMKRYQAADKTPMGQQQQLGGAAALRSTPAYYGTSYTKAKASTSTSSPSKPSTKATAAVPPPPPPPPVKHEPEPSPAEVVASAPSVAARSQVFGTMASSPKATMTAAKEEKTTPAETEVVASSEEAEKSVSIADRKKGFFKAAYSPKNKTKKAVEIPTEPVSKSPSVMTSSEPKKNVLNRYAPVVTSPSSGGGPSLKPPPAEEKIQKASSPTADSVGLSSHHSVMDRYHPEKKPAAAAAAAVTSTAAGTTHKPQPEKSTAPKGSVMNRYPVAGSAASAAPSSTKPSVAGNPDTSDKKPSPSVMERYSPAVVSKEAPTKPHVKIEAPSTGASKRSVMDRYHPESNHHNNNSSRSLGNSSNHSLGSVPGKKKSGHDFAASWQSKTSQTPKQMMSPKREPVDVDDPAWQAQLSESGVFAGWEHAQETAQEADNSKDDTAPLLLSNHTSNHEDYGFRGRFAAYRNAAATHYDDETDPSPHPNAPSSPTPRTAAKLASTASPKVSNSDLTRNVHAEVDRRRNCRKTFTQPLDTAPEDHDEKTEIVDFLYTFTKTYPTQADEREKIIHDQYPDSVGKFYKELVLGDGATESKISEKDFWQRFYFRCDEDRILKEAQKRDYQQRVAIGQTTRSKLLFNDAGDMVGTKEEENQTRVSSENQPAPRSILKTDRWNHKDQAALGIKQLQMIDSFDDDDDSRSYDQVPRVFEDLDDLNEASFSRIQATTSDSRGGSELTKTESENDEQLGDEALGSSIGAAAAGIRFVDDGLNKVREYQADIVAEHTDRLPEWWMQTVPYRTLEEVHGVESIDDANLDSINLSKVVYM
eukprot:CAMPEP_0113491054 /NCGR_PEP_ID=MMETSP0014_2-20120614/27361_1 /TAXON_ID=2857 /ORGANISM="Nitzschia sp." /LENGTH=1162 /DNA_ID=CAMNT_0000384839 /DNA_START=120 /DNA_END=3609 /DNA_ORIENTATION=- /assembly_acc=CAM_ASM_000159